jgi:Xaa-Pro aminopeptidase
MKKELLKLRELMSERNVDIYIIPTNDFHGSEYINDYFKTRKFISGFTGSAGTLLVTQKEAFLWTDGRYFIQAAEELKGSGINLMKSGESGVPTIGEYLSSVLSGGMTLGFDGRVLSFKEASNYKTLAERARASILYDLDLAGDVWMNRPKLSANPIWKLPFESVGKTYDKKLEEIRSRMQERGARFHLITGLEENAWLYGLRGSDVAHTPVFFSFSLISMDTVTLYIFDGVCPKEVLPDDVICRNYFALPHDLAEFTGKEKILIDLGTASYSLVKALPESCTIIDGISPASELKAVKNETEITSTRKAHIKDGLAMVRFIYWLKKNIGKENISELSAAAHLNDERSKEDGFLDISFETISAYMSNGAIVHYSPTPESDRDLAKEGFLLVDSGGHYIDGTTDITRTIALGPLTEKMKKYYTAVLAAHVDLAMCKFKEGTTGVELDKLTRKPIQKIGLDYNHGTGHGVGHILSVHEGPQNISRNDKGVKFLPGMITSDEPGVYIENEFGIRIENELLCIEKGNQFAFEFLTYCPYEPEAILKGELSKEQLSFVNAYHERVYQTLSPHLDPEMASWLRKETLPIE